MIMRRVGQSMRIEFCALLCKCFCAVNANYWLITHPVLHLTRRLRRTTNSGNMSRRRFMSTQETPRRCTCRGMLPSVPALIDARVSRVCAESTKPFRKDFRKKRSNGAQTPMQQLAALCRLRTTTVPGRSNGNCVNPW